MKCNPFGHMLVALALSLVSAARADDPIITLQPTNQTVIVGNRVSLVVAATTTNGPLSFQWQRSDDATPVAFTNLPNAKSAEFGYRSVSLEHTGDYRAIVANAGGNSVTSQVARIEVRKQPFTKITEGPLVNDLGVMPICPAWGDLNNDGYLDLLMVDYGRWEATNDFTRTVQMVYLNNADGTFRRATEADIGPLATRAVVPGPMSLADYDNDGYLDVYMYEGLNPEPEEVAYLYRGGPDGKFTLVGEDVGINRPLGPWLPTGYYPVPWGRSWVDYDQDGHLDIFLTTAWVLTDTVDQLWRNQGNGTFSRVLADVFNQVFDSQVGCWTDYDNDGDPDVLVGGYEAGTSRFYRNDGQGRFTDITTSLGMNLGGSGAWGDYDNDGRLDVYDEPGLFWNDGAGGFTLKSGADYPVGGGGGANWFDFDNDGYLDFFGTYRWSRRCMMRNNRDGTFTEVNLPPLTSDPIRWMTACADYDNDGFVDVVVPTGVSNIPNELYHNDGNENHWMLVKLVGTLSNRSAIGAKVRAQATIWGQDVRQMREISGTPWTGDPRAHFGLGDATVVDTLRIEWPSGIVQELKNVDANQILTVTEPPRLVPQGMGGFQIQSWINQSFEVQCSSNLSDWVTAVTVTNQTGTLVFEDAEAGEHDCRYYRVAAD